MDKKHKEIVYIQKVFQFKAEEGVFRNRQRSLCVSERGFMGIILSADRKKGVFCKYFL